MIMSKKITCCICAVKMMEEDSNSAYPINEVGRCCDECNYMKVIPARLNQIKQSFKPLILLTFR